jgi:hypothetical protein
MNFRVLYDEPRGLPEGAARLAVSLRAIGEGHVDRPEVHTFGKKTTAKVYGEDFENDPEFQAGMVEFTCTQTMYGTGPDGGRRTGTQN